jgi:hypothetical protein
VAWRSPSIKLALATAVVGAAVAGTAVPAAAAPGARPAARTWFVNLYRDSEANQVDAEQDFCPSAGVKHSVNLVGDEQTANLYIANGACKLVAFDGYGGTGTGVPITRDSNLHGLGSVAGHVKSIAQYG